ncbi:AraC family transcriptional regulator [Enterococcus sp. DIV0876]|uniref:AraC family transcriptional regulator n=1 Tax=Enterococcus sp. DIV0876 TaxID=2774633 RepID=UPI003D2FC1F6
MSMYLEIPEFESEFRFRTFLNDGLTIVYPHVHKEIEIIYAKRGTVNIGVDDTIVELQEGDLYLFASGQPHYFLASPESERYVYQFDLKLFEEALLRESETSLLMLFEEGEPHSRAWPDSFTEKITDLLIELYQLEEENVRGKRYLMMGLLYQIIGECYQSLPKRQKIRGSLKRSAAQYKETLQRLNQVFEYIESHYQDVLTMEETARYVGFSPHYFTRFFKTNTGKTFMQFLTEYRINQAKFILANQKIPMAEVAEKAGFASVKTFHHVFKETVGQSPLQYQKQLNLK